MTEWTNQSRAKKWKSILTLSMTKKSHSVKRKLLGKEGWEKANTDCQEKTKKKEQKQFFCFQSNFKNMKK
jgi:hypothetical protein